jgi:radical SAM protein with 4Fe4S-binding SPASM domain
MSLRYSHSKRDTLERCNRRYYYEYYGAMLRPTSGERSLFGEFDPVPKPKIDPVRIAAIRKLKTLTSCPLAAGDILHQLIATYLRKSPDWSVDWFAKKAGERFDQIVNYSRDPTGGSWIPEPNSKPATLLEFYYRMNDAEERAKQAREKLVAALERFFKTASIRELCCGIPPGARLVEAPISKIVVNGWTVSGKIDLAGRVDELVEVVDWKIGRQSGCHDSLQLITYGWWASRHYQVEPANVRVGRVFLGDGIVEQGCALSESLIQHAEARIIQDTELMNDLDAYGQAGNEEAFTPCGKANVCRNCKFQGLCRGACSATSSRQISNSSLARPQTA